MGILRMKERLAIAAQVTITPTMLSSPIKGWNTRDALDAMDPLDAVVLDNFYPDAGGVNIRNGYQSYATGMGANAVATLAEYNAGTTRKFIAACSGKFFDISASGAVGAPLISGFSSDQWQVEAFLSRLFFVNGTDNAQVYDGSTFADANFTDVALNTLIGVLQYQQRLFFWQKNSTGFWFAPLNSLSGALSFYDLGAYAPKGGNIIAATTYSHDGGNGVQDFIVFIFSSGDCIIFFGNDPSNATVWSQVGRYRISPPVSPRAVCNYGAEAFLTTFDDHVPLQQQLVALKVGALPPRSKISSAVQAAVSANLNAFGWQALYYPRGRRLIFNIPNPDGTFDQHVCNTGFADNNGLNPWCRFKNMNAFCFGLFKDNLYFGSAAGTVFQADLGSMDLLGGVTAVGQQAWNTFDDPQRKHMTAIRPLVQSVGNVAFNFAVGFDYGDINVGSVIAIPTSGSPWDTSPWDTSPWSAEQAISTAWRGSGGSGVAIGLALNIASTEPVKWLRSDLKYERGSAL